MKFQKLRLAGFKSFCEATDFAIEPGLTGVVGPNGCGKSNLVEALRWVMGENSYKNMRASGMEDVIFSGSGKRPARNVAEVGIVLDNSARTAPAAFNASDTIEITRKIERDHGSVYRINGREARARDVQLLFADASSGARSPAMVRQGQIGEIISARPQARRRILEEAAGVAGLHSRRHEAELRLKAAEENLARLEDVVKQLDAQIDSLKRQTRQAQRYRALAGDIRRAEALIFHIHHTEAQSQVMQAERAMREGLAEVAERTRVQAETARLQAVAAHGLPPLREIAAACAAGLQRLVLAREALDGEERRAKERAQDIDRRLSQLQHDRARETALIADAAAMLERLAAEAASLAQTDGQTAEQAREAEARAAKAQLAQTASDAALAKAQAALAELNARRNAIETQLRDERQRLARLQAEARKVAHERTALRGSETDEARFFALGQEVEEQRKRIGQLEAAGVEAERALAQTREAEGKIRPSLSDAERKAARLETELRTLEKLFSTNTAPGHWPSVLEALSVEKGFEVALGAALGDDLDASTNPEAPARWSDQPGENDPALPGGATPLATRVTAPAAMHRRLAQIGIVAREDAARLRDLLAPGQRLVTREGDLWRWDGFSCAAEAPAPAARRLAEKNRLGDLKTEAQAAREATRAIFVRMEQAQAATRAAAAAEAAARQSQRDAGRTLDVAREKLGAAERQRAQQVARLGALDEAASRLEASVGEAREKAAQAEAALAALPRNDEQSRDLDAARALAALDRAELAEARANVRIFAGEAEARARRAGAITADSAGWQARLHSASARGEELAHRESEAQAQQKLLAGAPEEFVTQRRALMSQIDSAEEQRKNANDALVLAETRMSASDRAARAALDAMASAREDNARAQAMVEAHRLRLDELLVQIDSELECGPADLAALAGLSAHTPVPDRAGAERALERLRADREKLGAVNLRAETELSAIEESKAALEGERDDLQEAIKRLRTAIASLNREGRERLQAAFEIVDGHFRDLFVTLFGGGEAQLQLVESDDPLEAGLEILARPPGKKPQTMTLLSGGEQALTAMALIFAVFLTNPAPICVLDEVDAPLDDANVERFCDLLDAMSQRTDTRFLTITHNPITMSRMNRLFGVTMAEQGVSQLVSVDLGEAERFLEAG